MWKGPLAKYSFLVGAAIIAPHLVSNYYVHILTVMMIYFILVDSLNLIYGMTGLLSLGQAAFYGIGAYTAALLNLKLGWGLIPGLLAGVILAGLAGAIIGIPTLRLRSSYLIISTLCFGKIVTLILLNWMDLTQGPLGLYGISAASIGISGLFKFEFTSKISFYYLALFFALGSHLLIRQLMKSRTGRSLLAIREDQLAAQALGVFVAKQKVLAFVMSAMLAGLAGVLYCFSIRCLSPEGFSIVESTEILIFLVLGGTGNIWGPIMGVLPAHLLLEELRFLGMWRLTLYGLLLYFMTRFCPQGLAGLLSQAGGYVERLLAAVRSRRVGPSISGEDNP
jgi:branched-chain amino acid transport system permease protein